MFQTAIASVLVAYLPGALAYRVPFAGRSLRAALPAEERLFWAVVLSVSWSLATVMADAQNAGMVKVGIATDPIKGTEHR